MKTNYYISKTESGEITQIMTANGYEIDGMTRVQQVEFEVLQHHKGLKRHYWDNGLVEKPEQPSNYHKFDYVSKSWKDPRTLEEIKLIKWKEIKEVRDSEINSPITTPYGVFDGSTTARQNLNQVLMSINTKVTRKQPVSINFTLYDNTVVKLNSDNLQDVGVLLTDREQVIRTKATALRNTIDTATTIEEVNNVVW